MFSLSDFDMSTNCPQYLADFQQASSAGTLDQFTINFDKTIYTEINEHFLNSILLLTSNQNVVVNYSIASCAFTCLKEITEPTGNLFPFYTERINCGNECCKRTTVYSYSVELKLWEQLSIRWDLPEEPCESNPTQCDGMVSSNCMGRCEVLTGF